MVSGIKPRKVSPVSAPALLFIISIASALVTAYMWMGTVNKLSQGEASAEVLNYTCAVDRYMNWEIVVFLNNSGGAPVVFTNVYVNSVEVSRYGAKSPDSAVGTITTDLMERAPARSGEVLRVTIWVGARFGFLTSRSVVRVQVVGEGGIELMKNVMLV
jgi:hypothetical protein